MSAAYGKTVSDFCPIAAAAAAHFPDLSIKKAASIGKKEHKKTAKSLQTPRRHR